jgi:hypothetical protein
MKESKLSKLSAVIIILLAGIVSWIIANAGVDYDRMELGALAPVIILPIQIAFFCVLFLIIDWLSGISRIRIMLTIVVIILILGIQLRVSE